MEKLLKALGLGVLYTVLSPFIAVFFVLYAVYCLFAFIYMAIRNLIVFFAGGNPMGDLPEDVKAKRLIKARQEQALYPQETPQAQTTNNNTVVQNFYQQPVQQNNYGPNNQTTVQPNVVDSQPVSNAPLPDIRPVGQIENQDENKEREEIPYFDDIGGDY